jgi:hypothetical protein
MITCRVSFMPSVTFFCYADCRYAECRGALELTKIPQNYKPLKQVKHLRRILGPIKYNFLQL